MKYKFKLRNNKIPKVKRTLRKVRNSSVEYGYFESQGFHSTWKVKYTDLAKWQEFGTMSKNGGQHIPPRPVFGIAAAHVKHDKAFLREATKPLVKRLAQGQLTPEQFLDEIGKLLVNKTKSFFGDKSHLKGNSAVTIRMKGKDNPLIWTGELRDKMAYRTSLGGTVKEV